ncbi:type III secretion system export apparatus subunit SctR [Bradyrhizobium sp. Tv2a-2]|uniref:type III secretion system export apparatus subunit SctR n=1 Tax=Bradyrhizobium sp. Tv2a-2 TaxID=113395 RepID=UPI0003F4CEB2|nr:type III secretion system export apparatus subunit SctR [Bradyrhizobium sp. Tv2a-2]
MNSIMPDFTGLLVGMTALGLLSFVAVTMTSFTKISVVLFLLRNALGIQQTPPNLVLYGIALLLSSYVMAPVAKGAYEAALATDQAMTSAADYFAAAGRAEVPVKTFLLRFTNEAERQFFANETKVIWGPDSHMEVASDDMIVVIPSFVLSELRRSFEIGFLLYLPFIAVDLVITAVLMAMGMSAVSPTTISVPFKLFLFVATEGWTRLIHGLVLGYAT